MRRADRSSRGFTLLEVLAAFLIFAVLFTQLAGAAAEAMRKEGENRRRLEASLLADAVFAEIEQSLRAGVVPPIGENVREEDIFTFTTTVAPLTLDSLGLDLELLDISPDSPGSSAAAPFSLLAPEQGQDPPLRQIDLKVTWEEGTREIEVRRTTFALDTAGIPDLGISDAEGSLEGELLDTEGARNATDAERSEDIRRALEELDLL